MYQQEYQRKRISMDQLLELFQSDLFIVLGSGPQSPVGLLSRLHELQGRASHIRLSTALPLKPYPVMTDPQYRGILEQESFFYSPVQRISDRLGECTHLPSHLRAAPSVVLRGRADPDLLVTSVSPMDEHGYFSICAGCLVEPEVLKRAKHVVVEVCAKAPRTFGDTTLHISRVDHIVECDRGLVEMPPAPIGEADLAIGRYVADLVEDGSTIQLGIGSIPNAVAQSLMHKRDLGMHTEMLVDSTVDLVEAGVLTGRCKTLHPNQIVTVFTMGTQRLYDFIDNNPGVLHRAAPYTNDPYVIAQNYKMTSINTTLQVDLFGQCASESVAGSQISGIGGQAETCMGAQMSPGGKSIMTLHSTGTVRQKDGSTKLASKIVPGLAPGTVVSTARSDVEYVVTEFGVAELKGKTVRDRAKALISIAHPDFQAELTEAAERFHIL
jgi:acyl-CoA hydrolase